MKLLRFLATLFPALLCLFLASCIEGKEEIWLRADGSGRAEFTYDLPIAAAAFQGGEPGIRELLGSLLKDLPKSTYEVAAAGDRLRIHVAVDIDSVADIKTLVASKEKSTTPDSFQHFAGIFDIRREGREVSVTRTISPGKAIPGVRFLPASQFQNRNLVYILHLPVAPEEANATRTEDGGKTLVWDYPLAEAIRTPIVTRFRMKIPIPAWAWAVGGAVVVLFGWSIFAMIRRRRRIAAHRALQGGAISVS